VPFLATAEVPQLDLTKRCGNFLFLFLFLLVILGVLGGLLSVGSLIGSQLEAAKLVVAQSSTGGSNHLGMLLIAQSLLSVETFEDRSMLSLVSTLKMKAG
jgi:hypothetical protein